MAEGKYENRRRRRRRRKSPLPMFIALVVLVFGLILVLTQCGGEKDKDPIEESTGQSTAQTTEESTEQTDPIVEDTTVQPPETTAEPTEAPTTAPATEPTTEPATEPTTEPTTVPTEAEEQPSSDLGGRVAAMAMDLVGCEYEYGGSGPDTFDISGLVYYCFQENGIDVPRALSKQAKYGQEVEQEDLLPGDVLFFWSSDEGQIQYVGIYVGDGKFVAARNSEKPVSVMELTSKYFSERFLFARRFWH